MLVLLWKPAVEMTPPVPAFMFWSTLVWLFAPCPSFVTFGVGVMGDARPKHCWIKGLARWFPGWLFVKCWYKLPRGGPEVDIVGDAVGACGCWTWFVTIVKTVELLLLLLLLLFVVGNWIPGTVVAEDNGTDTTRLSGCRSSFELPLNFAWRFGVITCDLLLDVVASEFVGEADVTWDEALVTVVEPAEWITLGFTFCMLGSCGGAVAAAGVDCVLGSVRA